MKHRYSGVHVCPLRYSNVCFPLKQAFDGYAVSGKLQLLSNLSIYTNFLEFSRSFSQLLDTPSLSGLYQWIRNIVIKRLREFGANRWSRFWTKSKKCHFWSFFVKICVKKWSFSQLLDTPSLSGLYHWIRNIVIKRLSEFGANLWSRFWAKSKKPYFCLFLPLKIPKIKGWGTRRKRSRA